jgi:hypothetical protein
MNLAGLRLDFPSTKLTRPRWIYGLIPAMATMGDQIGGGARRTKLADRRLEFWATKWVGEELLRPQHHGHGPDIRYKAVHSSADIGPMLYMSEMASPTCHF